MYPSKKTSLTTPKITKHKLSISTSYVHIAIFGLPVELSSFQMEEDTVPDVVNAYENPKARSLKSLRDLNSCNFCDVNAQLKQTYETQPLIFAFDILVSSFLTSVLFLRFLPDQILQLILDPRIFACCLSSIQISIGSKRLDRSNCPAA